MKEHRCSTFSKKKKKERKIFANANANADADVEMPVQRFPNGYYFVSRLVCFCNFLKTNTLHTSF